MYAAAEEGEEEGVEAEEGCGGGVGSTGISCTNK